MASSSNQIVMSPRFLSAASYVGQFFTLYLVLYFGVTLLFVLGIRTTNHVADRPQRQGYLLLMKRSEGAEQRWRGLAKAFEESGLTIQEFCAREGVSKTMFYKWRRRLGVGVRRRMRAAPKLEFVELRPNRAAPTVELVTKGGVVVRVGSNFDKPTLVRVLDVLRDR